MHWSLCGEETHRIFFTTSEEIFRANHIAWMPNSMALSIWLADHEDTRKQWPFQERSGVPLSVQMWYSFVIEHWKKAKATSNICMYSTSFYQISFTSFIDKISTNSDFLDMFFLSNKSNTVFLAWNTKNTQHCHKCHHHCLRKKGRENLRFFPGIPGLQKSYWSVKLGPRRLVRRLKNPEKHPIAAIYIYIYIHRDGDCTTPFEKNMLKSQHAEDFNFVLGYQPIDYSWLGVTTTNYPYQHSYVSKICGVSPLIKDLESS